MAQQTTGEERILGTEIKNTGITFLVATGGCTHKANFGLETLRQHPLTLRLVRLRPDYCEALKPGGTRVTFTFAEIGQAPSLTQAAQKGIVIVNETRTP
jgi:hypothetical protein